MSHPCRRTRTHLALALVLAAAAWGCGPGDDAPATGSETGEMAAGSATAAAPAAEDPRASTERPEQTPTRAALPGLFSVMAGLEGDMARLSRGLWQEDMDSIAAGAGAVADHPKIPPEEASRIAEALGPDMARFKAFDTEVHDLAARIRTLAGEGDLEAILAAEADLRQGCVGCHTAFRERLRSTFR